MKNYRNMSPDEIEQDIASTRSHIDRTLDVLTSRLSPSGLVEQAFRSARDTGGEFTLNLGRSIRDNPVPTALIGVGLGWLILAGRKSGNGGYIEYEDELEGEYEPRRRYQVSPTGLAPTSTLETSDLDVPEDWSEAYDDQGEVDAEGRSTVGDRVQAAKDAAKDTYEHAREGVAGAGSSLGESAKRGKDKARSAAERAKAKARGVGERVSEGRRRTSERAREMAHGLSDRASETAARAKSYGSSVADRAADVYHRGGDVAREAGWRAREAAGSAGSFAREHPIAVGLGIAALGAAIAAFLPRTRREDELMGEKADELKATAREQAEVQAERARDAAAAALEAGKQKAKEAGLTPEDLKEKLNETAAAAAGVAKSAAQAGADKAKESAGKGDTGNPGGSEPEPAGAPPAAPTGGVAGVSGISTPPAQGGSFGSTMDSHPVGPTEPGEPKADENK